jgi:hypothetical protein
VKIMHNETVTYSITGISALMTNNPSRMSKNGAEVGRKYIPKPEEEAAAACYKVGDNFAVPGVAFRSAILYACRGQRIGKTSAAAVLKGALGQAQEWCVLADKKGKPLKDYQIDRRRVVQQRQGIVRSRPRFEQWSTEVQLEVDRDIVANLEVLDSLLNEGGQKAGVGDFRPERGGWFGKFSAKRI